MYGRDGMMINKTGGIESALDRININKIKNNSGKMINTDSSIKYVLVTYLTLKDREISDCT